MGDLEQRAFGLSNVELRASGDGAQKLSGYFIEWDKLSNPIMGLFQEKFQRGAFQNLDGDIKALWQHDPSKVMGRTTNGTLNISEDERGAKFEITPDPNITWHQDAVRSIQRGDVSEMSFMFVADNDEWDDSNPDMAIRTVTEARLYEVSPVTFPAYPQTSVGVRSAQDVFKRYSEQRSNKEKDENKLKMIEIRKKRLQLLSKI